MKKQLIRDNGLEIALPRKGNSYVYRVATAFVSSNNQQVCSVVSCRDYMHDQIRTFLNNKERMHNDGHPYYPGQGDPDLCMSELRLLYMVHSSLAKKNLEKAVKMLNLLETYGKVKKSVVEKVKVGKGMPEHEHFLLKGSTTYMHNPHLLSALTLVMRYCLYNGEKIEIKDKESIKNTFVNIEANSTDRYLMQDCHKLLHIVYNKRKKIFSKVTLDELFPIKLAFDFHSRGGIQQLCKAYSPNEAVNKRIKELIKEINNEVKY